MGVLDALVAGLFETEVLPLSARDAFLTLPGLGALVQLAFLRGAPHRGRSGDDCLKPSEVV